MTFSRRDLGVTAVCLVVAAVLTLGTGGGWPHLATAAATSVAAGLTRGHPVAGVLLGAAATAVDQVLGPSLATALILTQVLYDAGVHGSRRLTTVLLWAGAVLTVVVTVALASANGAGWAATNGVLVALVLIVPVASGGTVRQLRRRGEAERLRGEAERLRGDAERRNAQQVARLAAMDDRQAVAAERARMARELHDVVANHLSVIAIHSTGALALDEGGERTRQALTVMRDNAVRALAELRESIRVLRMDGAGLPGTELGLAEVPALAERMRQAGVRVRVEVTGDARPLPIAVDMAAYRIVQESLTNAVKHGGDEVALTIAYGRADLTLTVTNLLGEPMDPDGRLGAGAGLIGMRERASLLGGTFSAASDDTQFRVRVTLPSPP